MAPIGSRKPPSGKKSRVWRTGFKSPYKEKIKELQLKRQEETLKSTSEADEENRFGEEGSDDDEDNDEMSTRVHHGSENYESGDEGEDASMDDHYIVFGMYDQMVRQQYCCRLKYDKHDAYTDDDQRYDQAGDDDPYVSIAKRDVNNDLFRQLFAATQVNTRNTKRRIRNYFERAPESYLWKLAAAASDEEMLRILSDLQQYVETQQPDEPVVAGDDNTDDLAADAGGGAVFRDDVILRDVLESRLRQNGRRMPSLNDNIAGVTHNVEEEAKNEDTTSSANAPAPASSSVSDNETKTDDAVSATVVTNGQNLDHDPVSSEVLDSSLGKRKANEIDSQQQEPESMNASASNQSEDTNNSDGARNEEGLNQPEPIVNQQQEEDQEVTNIGVCKSCLRKRYGSPNRSGTLLQCVAKACPNSYHLGCLRKHYGQNNPFLREEGEWFCPDCVQNPDIETDRCVVCNVGGDLILCDGCDHLYHYGEKEVECAKGAKGSNLLIEPNEKEQWFCPTCIRIPTNRTNQADSVGADTARALDNADQPTVRTDYDQEPHDDDGNITLAAASNKDTDTLNPQAKLDDNSEDVQGTPKSTPSEKEKWIPSLRNKRRSSPGSTKNKGGSQSSATNTVFWNGIGKSLCEVVSGACSEFEEEFGRKIDVAPEVKRSKILVTVETGEATIRFNCKVYKDENGVWDMKRFKRDMRRNWRSLTKAQRFAVCFIFSIESRRVDDSFPRKTELHHLMMSSLGGSDVPKNKIRLEVINHIKIHICYALIFDDIQVHRSACLMLHRGKECLPEAEYYQCLRDDEVLMHNTCVRGKYSAKLTEAHRKRKNKEQMSEQEAKIMKDWESMLDAYAKERQKVYDMAEMMSLGHTKPENEEECRLMKRVVRWTNTFHNDFLKKAKIHRDKAWMSKYTELEDFYQKNGHTIIRASNNSKPEDDKLYCNDQLYEWVKTQKKRAKIPEGTEGGADNYLPLSAEERVMLDELDFVYDLKEHDCRKWAEPFKKHLQECEAQGMDMDNLTFPNTRNTNTERNLYGRRLASLIGDHYLEDLTGYRRECYINFQKYTSMSPGRKKRYREARKKNSS